MPVLSDVTSFGPPGVTFSQITLAIIIGLMIIGGGAIVYSILKPLLFPPDDYDD